MERKINRLNIACGKDIKKGWVNLDFIKIEGVDVIHDLNKYPYPFKDNTFDEIFASHIIEHLDNSEKFLCELWRISKNNGKVIIRTPHFSSPGCWTDVTHRRGFSFDSLFIFSTKRERKNFNTLGTHRKELFEVKSFIRFSGWKRFLGLNYLVNLHDATKTFYERNFTYILQAEEVIFTLKNLKK